MAEARATEVLPQSNLFYCHKCSTEIVPNLPEYVCPRCHNGFIEPTGGLSSSSSSSSSDGGAAGRAEPYPPSSFGPASGGTSPSSSFDGMEELEPSIATLEDFLWTGAALNLAGSSSDGGGGGGTSGGAPSGEGNSSTGARRVPNRSRVLNALFMGPPNRRSRLRGPDRAQTLGPMLQDLIVHITSGGPMGGVPMFSEELASNPGDYAWGRGGLDAVITRLMNQIENNGPPPLTPQQIGEIPTVAVTEEQCSNKAQCSVCMEDFVLQENVKKLHCEHCFHEPCIAPWLQMHATCPVCRKSLNEEAPGATAQHQHSAPSGSQPYASRYSFRASPSNSGGSLFFMAPRPGGSGTAPPPSRHPPSSSSPGPSGGGGGGGDGDSSQDARMMEGDLD